jgi:holo-[acyl-carrier protein] synthase
MISNPSECELSKLENTDGIVGIGVDIIETGRFELDERPHENRCFQRMFSQRELDTATRRQDVEQFLAGRFALKEAVLKALPSANLSLLDLSQIDIESTSNGPPVVRLPRTVDQDYSVLGSISHDTAYAIGFAIVTNGFTSSSGAK